MKYIIRYTSLAFIFFVLHTTCIALHPVFAQNAALSIYPPLIESVIKPSKSVLVAYTIINEGDPVILSSGVSSFVSSGIEGNVRLLDRLEGPIRFNLENADVQLEKNFLIKSKEKKQLLLKIRVPEGTPEGDYYYTFYLRTDSSNSLGADSNAHAQLTLGANILISVTNSGRLDIKGTILKFSMKPDFSFSLFGKQWNFIDSTSMVPIDLIVHNDGRNVFKTKGTISVSGPFGNIKKYSLHHQNILTGTSRIVEASSEAILACSAENASALCDRKHSLLISGFYVGIHTATATIELANELKTASLSFVGVPIKFLIAIVSTVVMLIISIKLVKRNDIKEQ